MAKETDISKVLAAIEKTIPSSATLAKAGSKSAIKEVVPTGIDVLDHYILGIGGLPVGRIGEIYSDAGAGKSSLGFACLAGAQRAGGLGILVVTERDLLVERAELFGCNLEELLLVEPNSLEDTLDGIKDALRSIPKSCGPNVLVWDSLAATELEDQVDESFSKGQKVGKRALLMSTALPVICRLAVEHRTAIVVVNQVRSKIGVMFGEKETTPGGHSLKFHSSWRLQLWRGSQYKVGTEPVGIYTTVKAAKSKICPPFRKSKFRLIFETGWDNDWTSLEYGKDIGILKGGVRVSPSNTELVRKALLDKTAKKPANKVTNRTKKGNK